VVLYKEQYLMSIAANGVLPHPWHVKRNSPNKGIQGEPKVKTLNLYSVSYKTQSGAQRSLNVAAQTKSAATKQTKQYSATITKVTGVERIGNVNVPLTLPAGL
jgi:hypothetical protein